MTKLGICTVGRSGLTCDKEAVAMFDGVNCNFVCFEHLKEADSFYNQFEASAYILPKHSSEHLNGDNNIQIRQSS